MNATTSEARLVALADPGSWCALGEPRPSPYLARWGIEPRDDDGIRAGRCTIAGSPVALLAQDATFLGGSIGALHAVAIECACRVAVRERAAAIVLLLESGGVRLHEANAAEVALARALRALFDARSAGVDVVTVVTGSCFGGASVLACAGDATWMLPGSRLGLSGPKVIESVRGRSELDASDEVAVEAITGRSARVGQGIARAIDDDPGAIRGAISEAIATRSPSLEFARSRRALEWASGRDHRSAAGGRERVGGTASEPVGSARADAPAAALPVWFAGARTIDREGWLWRVPGIDATVLRPFAPGPMGVAATTAADAALVAWLDTNARRGETLLVVEDSPGHDVSRAAETACLSAHLARHAELLNVARRRGHLVLGLIQGLAHSAAFFVNALQADAIATLPGSRLEVMHPDAIARIARARARAEPPAPGLADDPVVGSSPRALATLGVDCVELRRADVRAIGEWARDAAMVAR